MSIGDIGIDQAMGSLALLLVEDDDVDRERTRRMIAEHAPGASVTEVITGHDALESLAAQRFDAILLDYHLSDCTAAELLPAVLGMPESRCPVIILTGHGDENLAVWALQHGAADYLGKNKLTATRLLDSIESSVTRWRRNGGLVSDASSVGVGTPSDEVRFRATSDGTIVWISDAVVPMLGWEPAGVIGTRIADHTHPDDPPMPVADELEARRWIHRYRHFDGNWRWIETTYRLASDAQSSVDEWIGSSRDITERVDADLQLIENEARYRRLVNLTGEAVVACNTEDVILFGNPALATLVGRSAPALVGLRFEELVHPAERDVFRRRRGARADGRTDSFELRLRDAWERDIWVEVNTAEMFELGDSTGWVARLSDISARREAERTLATTELHYRTWHEMSPIGLFRANTHGDLVYVNSKWREIVGWSSDRGVPTWRAIVHPDDLEMTMRRLRYGLETGTDFEADFRLLTPGQGLRWVSVRSVPIGVADDADGHLGTMEDITERREVQDALRRSEELYRSVIETMSEGVVILTAEGTLIEANPASRVILGVASGDLRDVQHVVREDGTDLPVAEFPAEVALQTGRPTSDITLGIRHPVLGERWLNVGAQPLRRGDDQPPWAAVCTMNDVTEQRKVDQLKNEFIGVVSHEMRTPLTSIKGSLGLIAAGAAGPLGETAQKMIDIALKNTDWLVRFVNEMLDLERIESGRTEMAREPADLGELINGAVTMMRPRAEREGLQLVNDATASDVVVVVHGDRIGQTVTNLLSNAIKFSAPGGTIRVAMARIAGADGHDEVVVRVIDNGRGVPPERVKDIFERFRQVDASDSRDKGGTGLGLAICKAIVEEHKGRIWMEHTPGGGATFTFTLPLPPDEGDAGDSTPAVAATAPNNGGQ